MISEIGKENGLVIYINLDERVDRKQHVEKELANFGMEAERFSAHKNLDGCIGCAQSHRDVLRLAISRNVDYVLVCEDDFTWKYEIEEARESLRKFFLLYQGSSWDVLLLSASRYHFKVEPTKYEGICKAISTRTATGYFVNKHYIPVLLECFEKSVEEMTKIANDKILHPENYYNKRIDSVYAIDVLWNELQKKDNWYFILPGLVKQFATFSNIEHEHCDYPFM